MQLLPTFLLHFWIQFGTALCLLLAAMELAKKRESVLPGGIFFLAVILALVESRLGLSLVPGSAEYIWAWPVFFPAVWAVGPTLLLVSRNMVQFALDREIEIRIHYLPAAILLLGETVSYLILPSETLREYIRNAMSGSKVDVLTGVTILGSIHQTVYSVGIWLFFRKISKETEIPLSSLVYTILFVVFATIQLCWFGYFLKNQFLLAAGSSFQTLGIVLVFLFTARHPNFFISLKSEIRQKRYEKTQIHGLDLDGVHSRIKELIEVDKIYREEALKIQDLAEKLLISPHQLSRILNETYGKNFNEFLNSYRVEEAKTLLLEDLERTVLSIAYDVGFNTKSTFNAQFLKITGMTPLEWRKKGSKL
ncbi:AraC family transcriptional regulator [Leptospira langatensis]|uniref:AraC family transcriptional regulator n=1 Tax=Leptospira langatensis TaxID=2484983 RepID=A0A5F1ZUI3_9LEPT|nr:helix-turn-helix domain-containing protein [Leptospira langatensis]TGJ98794.1 AraC family transcriptional regulator [Leptospira langatensis]TGL40639.1 AraC family transcriptional regulator [Leptospira langatensis]